MKNSNVSISRSKQNRWYWLFSIFCRVSLAYAFIFAGMVKIMGERFAGGLLAVKKTTLTQPLIFHSDRGIQYAESNISTKYTFFNTECILNNSSFFQKKRYHNKFLKKAAPIVFSSV